MSSKGTEKIKKNSASKAVAIRIFKNPMAIVLPKVPTKLAK